MRFAYADPPYLGYGQYYREHHPDALDWNDLETHRALVERLVDEFPDGWAMSLHSPALKHILPLCPDDCRISAWVKPFCSFKPNVNPAYAWEPVIWRGGRKRTREQFTVRDWISAEITLQRGLTGAKPRGFCDWLIKILNVQSGDEFVDLFPGTGAAMNAFLRLHGRAEQFELIARDLI
jgi:hypothetical protein